MAVLIIAEAGVNHEGRMEQAEQLVDIAAEAQVDVFKSQTFTAGEVVTLTCPPAEYQTANVNAQDQYTMLQKLELPYAWHKPLKDRCEQKGMEFLSTAFGFASFDFLMNLGLKRIKIPSGEISNLPFVVHQAKSGLPLILSTGMADMPEIKMALGAVACGYRGDKDVTLESISKAAGQSFDQLKGKVTVLHCTTDYPVKWDQVNMRALPAMRDMLGLDVGYSDHTPGLVASYAAVALGATVVEKHFTVTREWSGQPEHPSPDHHASLEPTELKALVEGIRLLEQKLIGISASDETARMDAVRDVCVQMESKYGVRSDVEQLDMLLGTAEKTPTSGAAAVAKVAKRSVVASAAIKPGDIFTLDNITLKRPTGGLSSAYFFALIGQPAQQAYEPDSFISQTEVPELKKAS